MTDKAKAPELWRRFTNYQDTFYFGCMNAYLHHIRLQHGEKLVVKNIKSANDWCSENRKKTFKGPS